MALISIFLLDSTLAFDRPYTYLAEDDPGDQGLKLQRGMFVLVPFGKGNALREGVIWNTGDSVRPVKKGIRLKKINRIYTDEPLTEEEISLATSLCENYACTFGTAVRCIRPFREKKQALGRTVEAVRLLITREDAKDIIENTRIRSIQQIKILEELSDEHSSGTEDTDRLLLITGSIRTHIKALEKKGYVSIIQREAGAGDVNGAKAPKEGGLATYSEHLLNGQQQNAYDVISDSMDSGRPEVFLLHGITGSGKTEVYMHLISRVLGKGGSVVMMVPEIALTPQMISHFTSRFGDYVAVWHSALTPAQRELEWYRMSKGIARVEVCTRSGIFAPMKDVGLVIIDEAHDGSYRSEESGLRYDTCEVARLKYEGKAAIVYGSATPDVTMYYKADNGFIRLLSITERAGRGRLPSMNVVDMREERCSLAQGRVISPPLLEALRENYQRGDQAMLFVGRRGYSSRLYCKECGKTMICALCGLPMTYHSGAGRLLCSYCGRTAPSPQTCPSCGSSYLGYGSTGTERVEQELKKYFPDAGVLRMDSDTVRGREGHAAILRRFQKEKTPFLVGTQMITKGHDFPGVNLVGIIDADSQINQPEYDAGEKAFQVIAQVAGRAGRDSASGQVLIQTYRPDDKSVTAALHNDYKEFYEEELRFRRTMFYPPFCSLATIRVSGKDDRGVYDYMWELASSMRDAPGPENSGISVLGPSREPIPKVAGRFRWQITVKAGNRKEIIELFLREYGKIKPPAGVRLGAVFEN